MIGITAPTYDLDGVLVVETQRLSTSTYKGLTRRSTRTATLDGSSVLNDLGFSDSDRTVVVKIKATESEDLIVENFMKFYSTVNLYMGGDAFIANPKRLQYDRDGSLSFSLEIISKVT